MRRCARKFYIYLRFYIYMNKVHVLISGQVQGVGFRYWAKRKMEELGISGWVENTDDGRVEAEFTGEEGPVKQMIELCREGPMLARVKKVTIIKE